MNDLKSKLPDLKELSSMSNKLFNGIKNAINEIVHDYKEKRAVNDTKAEQETTTQEAPVAKKAESKPKAEKTKPEAEDTSKAEETTAAKENVDENK